MSAAPEDRLGRTGALFLALWALSTAALAVLVVCASLRWHARPDPRPALIRALGLADIAVQPTGWPPRTVARPAFDPRFSPLLPGAQGETP